MGGSTTHCSRSLYVCLSVPCVPLSRQQTATEIVATVVTIISLSEVVHHRVTSRFSGPGKAFGPAVCLRVRTINFELKGL